MVPTRAKTSISEPSGKEGIKPLKIAEISGLIIIKVARKEMLIRKTREIRSFSIRGDFHKLTTNIEIIEIRATQVF